MLELVLVLLSLIRMETEWRLAAKLVQTAGQIVTQLDHALARATALALQHVFATDTHVASTVQFVCFGVLLVPQLR